MLDFWRDLVQNSFRVKQKEAEMNAGYIAKLEVELMRVCGRRERFETDNGQVEGATESDVIAHLTSGRDFIAGRQTRFPGIGSGWVFESTIKEAGFRVVKGKNRRGQSCRVVTI